MLVLHCCEALHGICRVLMHMFRMKPTFFAECETFLVWPRVFSGALGRGARRGAAAGTRVASHLYEKMVDTHCVRDE